MEVLYDEEKTTKDEYVFTINQGGELNIRVSNGSNRHVTITFVNGKLNSVSDTLNRFDLRSDWHVYDAISKKITELESKYYK